MTTIASAWLALALVLCVFCWFAKRQFVVLFLPIAAGIAAIALYVPLGMPVPRQPPPGKYTILGWDIVKDAAIYVLLKSPNAVAVYYQLPYTNNQASALQQANDDSADGGVPQMTVGDEGDVTVGVHRPSVPTKPAAETPAFTHL